MRNSIFCFTLLLALGCSKDNPNVQQPPESNTQQELNIADTDISAYHFELVPAEKHEEVSEGNFLVGWIHVILPEDDSIVQIIPVKMNEPQDYWIHRGVEKMDVNFDGYKDIAVLWHGGAKWGKYYWWLYDPETNLFYNNSLTEELNKLTLANLWTDPNTRQIKITRFHGAEIKEYSYQLDEEHLSLIGSIPDVNE